jgi:uncharacterized protein (TIRG00374 family)
MKKTYLFLISFLVGVLLLVLVIKIVGWNEIRKSLLIFTGFKGLIIFLLTFLWMLIINWKWKEILKTRGTDIGFFNLFKPFLAGFSVLYLFPTLVLGGEFLRGYILKKKYSLSWSKGMASVFIDRIVDWTTNLGIVFLGMGFFLSKIGILPKKIGLAVGFTFFIWLLFTIFFYIMAFKKKSIVRLFFKIFRLGSLNIGLMDMEKEIFDFFNVKNISFWKIIGIALLEEAILLFRIYILLIFLGKEIGFLVALSISGFYYLSTMIPIPASLGIQDGVQAFAFGALRLGASVGTAFTLIIRTAELAVALIGIILLFRLGIKVFEDTLYKEENKEVLD